MLSVHCLSIGTDGAVPESSGPDQDTLGRGEGSPDWLLHHHDYSGTRHSRLTQIYASNASRLVPVCMFQMGEFGNFQTAPIVNRGVMYVTSPSVTVALDAATCRVKWRHTWEPKDDTLWNRNRGIAIKDGRVERGTGDGYLLSLNAETGALLWARQVASPEDGETFKMPTDDLRGPRAARAGRQREQHEGMGAAC